MCVYDFYDHLIGFGIAVENLCCTVVLLVGDAYGGKLRCYYGIQQHTQTFSIRLDDHGKSVFSVVRKCEQVGILLVGR
ncbi:hypothetical protein H6G91_22590 [Nostoc muscorum FACHB-395]|nr:hypothetical protein [Desmonostoc muscorum FACHB-395]